MCPRPFALLAIVALLLTSMLGAALLPKPATAAGGSTTVDNSQSNGAATGTILDDSQWPTVKVRVTNDHGFWLKIDVFDNLSVTFDYDNTWAKFGYIPLKAAADFTLHFDPQRTSHIQFFVNAGQTRDGSPSAALITTLQRTVDTILTGVGATKDFQDADAQQLLNAIDQLNKLPDCVDAVEGVLGGDPAEALKFAPRFQTCLTDPTQAAVLTSIAAEYGVSVSAETLKNVVFTPVKILELTTQVGDNLAAILTGSWAGSVVFSSEGQRTNAAPAPSTPGPVPELSVYEVVGRTQAAIQDAGTYRFQSFHVSEAERAPFLSGEVDVQRGQRTQGADGSHVQYYVGITLYEQRADGTWSVLEPPRSFDENLILFLRLPATDWALVGTETADGRPAYLIKRDYVNQRPVEETLWVDAATFLPFKDVLAWHTFGDMAAYTTETMYSDFGAPVDVQVPPEALATGLSSLGIEASPAPTMSAADIISRSWEAIKQAGTFRFEQVHENPSVSGTGEVNISQDAGEFVSTDGSSKYIIIGREGYRFGSGEWSVESLPNDFDYLQYIESVAQGGQFELRDTETSESTTWYVIGISFEELNTVIWIDSVTFLPAKMEIANLIVFSDFGAPVNIQVPPEALAASQPQPVSTPGSEPTPPPANPGDEFLGVWQGENVTLVITRSDSLFIIQSDNPAGMLNGTFAGQLVDGRLDVDPPNFGDIVYVPGADMLLFAGEQLYRVGS